MKEGFRMFDYVTRGPVRSGVTNFSTIHLLACISLFFSFIYSFQLYFPYLSRLCSVGRSAGRRDGGTANLPIGRKEERSEKLERLTKEVLHLFSGSNPRRRERESEGC